MVVSVVYMCPLRLCILGTEARSELSIFVGAIAESDSGPCVGRDPKESLFEVDRWRPVFKGLARTYSIHVAPSAQHTQASDFVDESGI
ncbi:hypothetical protein VTH06DRAFT_396 [Thermothelomyces fergusii]